MAFPLHIFIQAIHIITSFLGVRSLFLGLFSLQFLPPVNHIISQHEMSLSGAFFPSILASSQPHHFSA
jgi:hypothetical protein